jgi:hypothetical protein
MEKILEFDAAIHENLNIEMNYSFVGDHTLEDEDIVILPVEESKKQRREKKKNAKKEKETHSESAAENTKT